MTADPKDPQSLSARLVGRVVDAVRHAEGHDLARYNAAAPPAWRDQRGERHVQAIKVTGSDLAHRYLWPATVRYWAGYAAGVHTFADWPDAGAGAVWATVVPGGDDLVPDGEYVAQFVGIHADGKAVFEALGGAAVLNTQNVDGTQVGTTTDMRFDQETGIHITQGATPSAPDVVSLVYSVARAFVGNVCVTVTLTKTNAATLLGGETVLHDVTAAVQVYLEKNAVTLPTGTPVGVTTCVRAAAVCCTPSVASACCTEAVPETLHVTVSGGGGSYALVWSVTDNWWISAMENVPGCGLMQFVFKCVSGVWKLSASYSADRFAGTDCWFADVSADSVSGCSGSALTSVVFTATPSASFMHTCGCLAAKTFTVTP